jgi:hypothetical protein
LYSDSQISDDPKEIRKLFKQIEELQDQRSKLEKHLSCVEYGSWEYLADEIKGKIETVIYQAQMLGVLSIPDSHKDDDVSFKA